MFIAKQAAIDEQIRYVDCKEFDKIARMRS